MGMDIEEPRRVYAILRISHGLDSFKIENISSVPYQSVRYPCIYFCLSLFHNDLSPDFHFRSAHASQDTAHPRRLIN
jgi:hypothetical protein